MSGRPAVTGYALLGGTLLFLACPCRAEVAATVDTVAALPGESVTVGVRVAESTSVVGALQIVVSYDAASLDVTSADWTGGGTATTARHAEHVDTRSGRVKLAAYAPAGASLADAAWRLNVDVRHSAAGRYDLRVVSAGTPDTAASFAAGPAGSGRVFAAVSGAVEVIDVRPRNVVATVRTNGSVRVSWIDGSDSETGYRVEKAEVTDIGEWVVDNLDAVYQGTWTESTVRPGYYGSNYQHDGNTDKGSKWARFPVGATNVRAAVSLWWTSLDNRASNVPVTIRAADGDHATTVDQRGNGSQWNAVGTYDFGTNGYVELGNAGADNYVIADAVKFAGVALHDWTAVGTGGGDATSLVDTGVVREGSYRYRVYTLFAQGDGPHSDGDTVTVPGVGAPSYALSVANGNGSGSYATGATVRIEAVAPPAGLAFGSWTGRTEFVTDSLSSTTTLRMPAEDIGIGAVYQAADGDGDGMEDRWELAQFGSVNAPLGSARGDIDGDGFANADEHRAFTDPIDGSSLLVIEGVAVAATGVHEIAWQSAEGCTYELQRAPSPTGAWTTVRSAISPTPPTNTASLSDGAASGFLRIVVR